MQAKIVSTPKITEESLKQKFADLRKFKKINFSGPISYKVATALAEVQMAIIKSIDILAPEMIKKYEDKYKKLTGLDFKKSFGS